MPVKDSRAPFFQHLGQGRPPVVGTGNRKSFLQQDFGKAAHADTADSYKVYVNWFVKFNLIHKTDNLFSTILTQADCQVAMGGEEPPVALSIITIYEEN